MNDIDARIAKVVSRDACSGCGACTLLDDGLRMRLDDKGYLRPKREAPPVRTISDPADFETVCPGAHVKAPRPEGANIDPLFGPYVEVWRAWATDPAVRRQGSSGGTLTALAIWLIESGRAFSVTGAAVDSDPRRTVPVTITTRAEAMKAAGSRYAPVAAASNRDLLAGVSATIGKPCEVSALRALSAAAPMTEQPLLLSFFCAGTPSAHATDALVEQLGFPADSIPDELWYRGRGWPGEFTVRSGERERSTSYDDSWGKVLGRTTQWRCKTCVDGTGEQADIVAADSWATDERGYPLFEDGEGVSALIARTRRGQEVVRAAIAAGVLSAAPEEIRHLEPIQPLQVDRRKYLLGRLIGSILAGRRPPAYPGYGATLWRFALKHPRQTLRVARGTWARVRTSGRDSRRGL